MKTLLTIMCAGALTFAGSALAQDKSTASRESKEVQQETKTSTNKHTAKTLTDTVYGKVESFDPGKSIKVTEPGTISSTKSFDLEGKNITAHVPAGTKVGEWVKVTEKTDNNGHKTITVAPSSEKMASREKKS